MAFSVLDFSRFRGQVIWLRLCVAHCLAGCWALINIVEYKMKICLFWVMFISGAIAMVGDFVVPSVIARSYPGYSLLRDTISTLGTNNSPVRAKTTMWLIILGVFFLVFALGQGIQFHSLTWRHSLYLFGIVMFGLGACIIAGIFPEDAPEMKETVSGKLHGIGAGVGSILLLLSPLWATGIKELVQVRVMNALGFAGALVAFALFVISGKSGKMVGLWQRLYLAVIYIIILANGFVVLNSAP